MNSNNNSFRNRFKTFFPVMSILILTVFFQNCGQNTLESRLPSSLEQETVNQNDQLTLPVEVIPADGLTTNLIFTAPNSGKKIYYVATNGSDSNPGSITKPFKTIARGSKAIASGDTLYIRVGTYNEFGPSLRSGTTSAYTRYAAYPGEERKVIIKPPKTSGNSNVVYFPDNAAYIELRGLVIDGVNLEQGYGIKGIRKSLIINNVVRNRGMGLGGGRDSKIIGNLIYNMSDYGIYTGGGDNGFVEGNIFHDCGGFGIHHYKYGGGVNNWTFRNNIIYRSGRGYDHDLTGSMIRTSPAVLISSGRYNKFYNNIVYDSSGGISVGYGAVDTLIANNTVYLSDKNGIVVNGSYAGSLRTRVINNIFYGTKDAPITNTGTETILQKNLTTDPKFVNALARNFRLRAGSPAINKGVTVKEVPKDFLGVTRPRGSAHDIGAYEF